MEYADDSQITHAILERKCAYIEYLEHTLAQLRQDVQVAANHLNASLETSLLEL